MEEERQLPKNIRQIGEKEERIKIYLEDYVHTFIQKKDAACTNRAGILLGNKCEIEKKPCLFIKGAVELEGLLVEDGVCFSEEMWKKAEEEIEKYFSECSICGWYIQGERLLQEKEDLKKVHRQMFSEEHTLMYWNEEDTEEVWAVYEGELLCLSGYYVYYERNLEMQTYMLSIKQIESEQVNDEAAKNFRRIMKKRQGNKKVQAAVWNQIGTVTAVAVIFVGTIYLIGRYVQQQTVTSVPSLAVGAVTDWKETECEMSDESETVAEQVAKEDLPKRTEMYFYWEKMTQEPLTAVQNLLLEDETERYSTEESQEQTQKEQVSAGKIRYIIQPGDTLAAICIKYYGSTDRLMEICENNEIENPNTIFIGQEIVLP